MPEPNPSGRRPLASRNVPFFRNLASALARAGVTPNTISFFSIIFALGSGTALAWTAHADGWMLRLCWLGAAAGIQLRLMANLLDGLVAVEGGKGGPTGELWNEAPDRFADVAIFIGAGFAAGSDVFLGFGAALAAVLVAYIRALGASVGAGQVFLGPQAKPHRMFVLTVTCITTAALPAFPSRIGEEPLPLITLALWIVIVGCIVTIGRRLACIAAFLREKAHK
jgi:phosphatidylglycerophosphate synthase